MPSKRSPHTECMSPQPTQKGVRGWRTHFNTSDQMQTKGHSITRSEISKAMLLPSARISYFTIAPDAKHRATTSKIVLKETNRM